MTRLESGHWNDPEELESPQQLSNTFVCSFKEGKFPGGAEWFFFPKKDIIGQMSLGLSTLQKDECLLKFYFSMTSNEGKNACMSG